MYGQPYTPPMAPPMNPYNNNMYAQYQNPYVPYQGMPNLNMPAGGQLSNSGYKINNPETATQMKSSYGGSWGKSKK